MKPVRFFLGAAAMLAGAGIASAMAATIQIDNRSGKAIAAIVAAPKGETAAATNLLGDGGIAVGAMGELPIEPGESQCVYDIRIDFADGSSLERPDMDVCQTEMLIVD